VVDDRVAQPAVNAAVANRSILASDRRVGRMVVSRWSLAIRNGFLSGRE
jgi:hypothetical protein